ncbi:unnamed protein product [Rotaria sp. Silwood2]|nr:unnamed protein product [Rotaria sp. Silwood2]CAF4120604.1 unnamed protein product [Rotaria sp. Silwood2]
MIDIYHDLDRFWIIQSYKEECLALGSSSKGKLLPYYHLLHEHSESLHHFYSSSSTFTYDNSIKTITETEPIAKCIEELSLKQRHVKIRQVDCHSTVGSSVVVQVCGEVSSTSINNVQSQPFMKRFVQTFVLTSANNSDQKYYAHNDIFQKDELNTSLTTKIAPPVTPVVEQTLKLKSYLDAIGKKKKLQQLLQQKINQQKQQTQSNKSNKQQQKSAKASGNNNANRTTRGHPQDTNNYYDDSWYYGNGEDGYLSIGYRDDQEVFAGNLSTQVAKKTNLLLVRIVNAGSQVGAANFAFVVCQSIEMAKALVADHENLLKTQKINVEAKKRRPFPHTFRPTYSTAASPTSYQSIDCPASFYNQSAYYEGVSTRDVRVAG